MRDYTNERYLTMNKPNYTLEYYNNHTKNFIESTVSVVFETMQNIFLEKLTPASYILDFGCGSGRDTAYFLSCGYQVDATDGSEELCRFASDYTGIEVKHQLFQELDEVEKYSSTRY